MGSSVRQWYNSEVRNPVSIQPQDTVISQMIVSDYVINKHLMTLRSAEQQGDRPTPRSVTARGWGTQHAGPDTCLWPPNRRTPAAQCPQGHCPKGSVLMKWKYVHTQSGADQMDKLCGCVDRSLAERGPGINEGHTSPRGRGTTPFPPLLPHLHVAMPHKKYL